MKKTRLFWGIGVFIILLSSCFHGRQNLSVIGYRHGQVFIKKGGSYKVGELPASWRMFKTGAKAITFHNDGLKATISTDAFCGASFEDLPLKILTGQMFAGVTKRSIIKEEEFLLDGRGALRTIAAGETDGVPLKFDSVIIKKNNCTIDLIYISPPENYSGGVSDFEIFFKGFVFTSH